VRLTDKYQTWICFDGAKDIPKKMRQNTKGSGHRSVEDGFQHYGGHRFFRGRCSRYSFTVLQLLARWPPGLNSKQWSAGFAEPDDSPCDNGRFSFHAIHCIQTAAPHIQSFRLAVRVGAFHSVQLLLSATTAADLRVC
jgi:hypothetical protein